MADREPATPAPTEPAAPPHATPPLAIVSEPLFLEGPAGPLFCLFTHPNHTPWRSALLYLPPFAEEMNRARRMAALQARHLARAGHAVLQLDYTGTGDSHGDFGQATWATWRDDARHALAWLAHRHGSQPWLWGLRLGAALAVDLARTEDVAGLLLWQPVLDGQRHLQHFLRLAVAADLVGTTTTVEPDSQALNRQLADGIPVEIAGYTLSPPLAQALAQLEPCPAPPHPPVHWLELSLDGRQLAPASQRVVEAWQAGGTAIRAAALEGAPFWTTAEITTAESLLDATLAALEP